MVRFNGSKNRIILVAVTFLLLVGPGRADSGKWELGKNEGGIAVWTRDVAGSDFKEFYAQMTVSTSLSTLVAVMDDTPNYTKFMHNCTEAKILWSKQTKTSEIRYTYTVMDPPVVSNRDIISKSVLTQDPDTKIVTISVTGAPDYTSRREDHVRVTKMSGYWKFIPKGDGKVKVVYQLHSEPGGGIPGWLANSGAVDIPWETFRKMRQRINLPKYKNKVFKQIQEPKE